MRRKRPLAGGLSFRLESTQSGHPPVLLDHLVGAGEDGGGIEARSWHPVLHLVIDRDVRIAVATVIHPG
jgi:hypothetical protein